MDAHLHMYHFFDKFRKTLQVLDNCTFIYTIIHKIILLRLPILKMHMCIYMYEHDITCFWYTTLNTLLFSFVMPYVMHYHTSYYP
ncbi:hypothetical protein Hanom_Chr16g01484461 [Helianthus anomalus]